MAASFRLLISGQNSFCFRPAVSGAGMLYGGAGKFFCTAGPYTYLFYPFSSVCVKYRGMFTNSLRMRPEIGISWKPFPQNAEKNAGRDGKTAGFWGSRAPMTPHPRLRGGGLSAILYLICLGAFKNTPLISRGAPGVSVRVPPRSAVIRLHRKTEPPGGRREDPEAWGQDGAEGP